MKAMPFLLAALAVTAAAQPARAVEHQDFTPAALAAANTQHRPVLVDVKAWWCPVCHSQSATIAERTKDDPRFARLLILDLNYDKQKPEWQALGIHRQATLIAYRAGHEAGRLEFRTNKDEIAALLGKTAA